jgi:hypothetical protein
MRPFQVASAAGIMPLVSTGLISVTAFSSSAAAAASSTTSHWVARPPDPSDLNLAYASVGNLHPNLAGYQVTADTVPLSMLEIARP